MSVPGVKMKLPLRIIPRRSNAIALSIFVPVICVFVLWGFAADILDELQRTSLGQVVSEKPLHLLALGIGVVVLLWMEFFAILRILPGSPYFHFDVTEDGLKRRDFRTDKFLAWNQIASFDVVGRMQGSKKKRMHYWLLAEEQVRKTDERDDMYDDVDKRIKHALLAYDTDELSPMFASSQKVADDLLQFLKDVHADRLRGTSIDEVEVPPLLRDVIDASGNVPSTRRSNPAVAKPKRSGGVIER